jgi:hypothetical protein
MCRSLPSLLNNQAWRGRHNRSVDKITDGTPHPQKAGRRYKRIIPLSQPLILPSLPDCV